MCNTFISNIFKPCGIKYLLIILSLSIADRDKKETCTVCGKLYNTSMFLTCAGRDLLLR